MLPGLKTIPDYQQITSCTESYFAREGDSALGMGWPNLADAVTRYNVMLDVVRRTEDPVRLLDFGCGTGHLYEHLPRRPELNIQYTGIDLSPTFIKTAQAKHPKANFLCGDVLRDPGLLPVCDYAVVNGVFTSKCSMSFSEMFDFVQTVLKLLFSRVTTGLAFNAMSKQVDWERDDLFHLPLDTMAGFVCRELSRDFVIRNDYGLYEFTTYVYHRR
ncbi:MAG: class I SAM-dependent methyltransferase [Fuerstiella sp.]